MILLEEGEEKLAEVVSPEGELEVKVVKKGMKAAETAKELERLDAGGRDVPLARMLRHKVRYFTAAGVVGSRGFVEEVFLGCREKFGPKRKTGARKFKGAGAAARGTLWGVRDLKVNIL
jgi:hypothetical protein